MDKDIIKEAVEFGSVEKVVDATNVELILSYLSEFPKVSLRRLIAFYVYCKWYSGPVDTLYEFLDRRECNSVYRAFVYYYMDDDKYEDDFRKLGKLRVYNKWVKTICDINEMEVYDQDDISLLVATKADAYLSALGIVEEAFDYDHVDYLISVKNVEKVARVFIMRYRAMRDTKYWKAIEESYLPLVKKLSELSFYTRDEYEELTTAFPTIFNGNKLSYSTLAWDIQMKPRIVMLYLLGILEMDHSPDKEMIDTCLVSISSDVEKYKELMKDKNRMGKCGEGTNEQDVMMENCVDYLPFDIIPYWEGDTKYIFTRPEIPSLVEKRKNHWTNQPLSDEFIHYLTAIHVISEDLPKSEVINTLYGKVATLVPERRADGNTNNILSFITSILPTLGNGSTLSFNAY